MRLVKGNFEDLFHVEIENRWQWCDSHLDGEQLDEKDTAELIDAIWDQLLTCKFRLQGPINFAEVIRRIQQYNVVMKVNEISRFGLTE